MTMNAKVRRHLSPDDFGFSLDRFDDHERTGAICAAGREDPRDGFLVELVLTHPESAKGRKVVLRLTEKDRDDLLLLLRDEAIRARRAADV